jgi:hypothetical protein
MTKNTRASKKLYQFKPRRELIDGDMDLGLKLFEDFANNTKERNADFNAIFRALAAIVEALTVEGELSIDLLISSIGDFATHLQATVKPEPNNH